MVSDTVSVSGFMFLRVVVDVLVTLTQRPFTILDLFDLAFLLTLLNSLNALFRSGFLGYQGYESWAINSWHYFAESKNQIIVQYHLRALIQMLRVNIS